MREFLLSPFRWLVLVGQSILMALAQIWSNKLRSLLTTVGIVIGVAAVTAVIAALTGMETRVLSEFEQFGTNKVFVFPVRTESDRERNTPWDVIRFRPTLFDDLLPQTESIRTFTRLSETRQNIRFGQQILRSVPVVGIEPSWHEIERRFVTVGQPFSVVHNEQALPVALVNQKLVDTFGLNRDPTGTAIMVGDRRYTIVGIVEENRNLLVQLFDDDSGGAEVFVPFSTMYRMNPRGGMFVVAAANSTEQAEDAVSEMRYYLRGKRGIGPGEEENFGVRYVERVVQQFRSLAAGIRVVAVAIVGISLIVGGVGIMNIMLVSVSERTREIGLRKAVGARPGVILLQFLIEAITLCCVGGAIGLAIGQLMTLGIRSIKTAGLDSAYIPLWAVILSFGFSALVGLVFGMFPALKAARLDPIDALRHE